MSPVKSIEEKEYLAIIKNWLKSQPYLPDTWDDQCIITLLRTSKYSLQRCKKKIDTYFTLKGHLPEFFANRDIYSPEIQNFLKISAIGVLPKQTPDGSCVSVFWSLKSDFETPNIDYVCQLLLMLCEIEGKYHDAESDIFIIDAKDIVAKHFYKVSFTSVKKFIILAQKVGPIRVKGFHLVNPTPFIHFAIKAVFPFVKEKLQQRVHVHSDFESLHRFVPRDILPEEFGGTYGKIQDLREMWIKKYEEHNSWLKTQEKLVADETKRFGKQKSYQDFFGIEGSFKQLSID